MNQLEQRLQQAAEELRQAARQSPPPPLPWKRSPLRGWLIFATAFAAVVASLAVLPLFSGDSSPVAGSAPTTAISPPQETTTTVATSRECSASGLDLPGPQEGLPAPVADVRVAMAEAAIACDFAALEALAAPDLVTSFGGGGFANLPQWEDEGQGVLVILVKLLDIPYATQEPADLPRFYVWPAAFAYETWEEIPDHDLAALRSLYTDEELEQLSGFGSYAGWRIGITETGEWKFFVAGD